MINKTLLMLLFCMASLNSYSQELRLVTDLDPGSNSTFGSSATSLNRIITTIGDVAMLAHTSSEADGWVISRSDGTESGTYQVLDAEGEVLRHHIFTEDAVYSVGGDNSIFKSGIEPDQGAKLATFSTFIIHLTYFENALYFGLGYGNSNAKLMKYDLVTDELTELMSLGIGVMDIGVFQGQLLFMVADTGGLANLYLSDGTIAGTTAYYEFPDTANSTFARAYLTVGENMAFFFFRSQSGGYRLFSTDGTDAGTQLVGYFSYHTWNTSYDLEKRRQTGIHNGIFYFVGFQAGEGSDDSKVYVSDGENYEVLSSIAPDQGYFAGYFTVFEDQMLFAANTDDFKTEIYVSDGTDEGTEVLINGDDLGSGVSFGGTDMVNFNGGIAFNAYRGETGTELWVSDGTTAGTEVKEILSGSNDSEPMHIAAGDNLLFFSGVGDGNTGRELYVYDPNGVLPNVPVAGFDFAISELEVTFEDQSDFEPTEWLWDFGDGNTSTETNPTHNYANPGDYQVCLTASNSVGNDMICVDVTVMTTGVLEIHQVLSNIYPNPVSDLIHIPIQNIITIEKVSLINMNGKIITPQYSTSDDELIINLPNEIPTGRYLIKLIDSNGQTQIGSIIVVD